MVYRSVQRWHFGLLAGINAGMGTLVMQDLQKWDIDITRVPRLA